MPTILVVDDEPEILNIIDQALSRHGFEVLKATGGNQAIELFEKSQTPVALLLTDVVMPGMSGPMVVDRLLAANPSLPVLFMSAYDERQVVQRYVVKEGFALLVKPFDLKMLEEKIRELLPASPLGKSQHA